MKKPPDLVNLKSAKFIEVSNGGLKFDLGVQSSSGIFFKGMLTIGYIGVVFLSIVSIFKYLTELDYINFQLIGEISISAGAVVLLLFVLLIILLHYRKINLLTIPSLVFLILPLFILSFLGAYGSYFQTIFLYLFFIIIASHTGQYIVMRKGDRLVIRLLPNKYEIYYYHNKIDFGSFSQKDIEIRVSDAAEAGDRYDAVFLPATKKPMGYAFSLPGILMTKGYGENTLQEIVGDLEKLFHYLGVDHGKSLWIIKRIKA